MKVMRGLSLTLLVMVLYATVTDLAPIPINSDENAREVPTAKKPKIDTSPKCTLLLSEVKIGFQLPSPDLYPFVELKMSCIKRRGPIPKNVLKNYKFLILETAPLSIVTIIDFQNFLFNEDKKYVVIGSPQVPNVDISMASPTVQSIFSRVVDSHMFPVPSEKPYLILLIRDDKDKIENLSLFISPEGVPFPRLMSERQIESIAPAVVDMMLISELNEPSKFDYVYFWKRTGLEHVFADNWKSFRQSDVYSTWSNCGNSYNGFDAKAFKLALASPGQPNNCGSDMNNLPDISDGQCEIGHPLEKRKTIHTITQEDVDGHKTFEFDSSWITKCQQYFPLRERILEKQSLQSWIKFYPETDSCRFVCFTCQEYRRLGFRSDIKTGAKIVTNGYFSRDIYDNSDRIKTHETTILHKESVAFHQAMRGTQSFDDAVDVIRSFEDNERLLFNATMNVFLMEYALIKAGISFKAYETIIKGVKFTGANVGWLHHTEDKAQVISKVISGELHTKLLKYLVANNIPFSILVDASTSYNQPYLAVYLQAAVNGVPVTYFYSLIHLGQGERGKAMSDSLAKKVEEDNILVQGFSDYFKNNIVSIISDGASNMVGIRDSFKVHLGKYVGRDLPNVECLAHKLDNAFHAGVKQDRDVFKGLNPNSRLDKAKMEQITYFESFEKTTNEFYTFYASYGHKKWNHLLETADNLGLTPKRLKYVFPIRWSESHFQALETIHHNYYALVEDLEQISQDDKQFDEPARTTAIRLHQRMTDKTYMLVLHEFLDVLSVFKIASKRFQTASSIIVGKVEVVYEVLYAMEQFKEVPGNWLKGFLAACSCLGKCDEGACTLNEFDECPKVILNNLILQNHFTVALHYSYVRTYLYTNMISSLKRYFKLDLLESFELFNPVRLNFEHHQTEEQQPLDALYKENAGTLVGVTYITPEESIHIICNFYNMPEDQCKEFQTQWRSVVGCVTSSEVMSNHQESDAITFWSLALKQCPTSWTTLTRDVIGFVMSTPYSSSECERGFSLMNYIKTKGRSLLEKQTLDGLLRVKVNGPPIELFYDAVYEYTSIFLKTSCRSDDQNCGGRKVPDIASCDNKQEYYIY